MPTVPKRSYPEFDAPSETHLQMAEASLRQQSKEYKEFTRYESLRGWGGLETVSTMDPGAASDMAAFKGAASMVKGERFKEAMEGWPLSKKIEDRRWKVEHPDQWLYTGQDKALHGLIDRVKAANINDTIGDLLKNLGPERPPEEPVPLPRPRPGKRR